MGRKAKNKQAGPIPLPGSDLDKSRNFKGKKRAPSSQDDRKKFKSVKTSGLSGKSLREQNRRKVERVKKVDEVDEDSDLDEALQTGWVFILGYR